MILNELMDDEQEFLDEMTGAYQTSEIYSMIQQEIASAFPDSPLPVDDLDIIDFIPQKKPDRAIYGNSAPSIGAGYRQSPSYNGEYIKKSEDNMAGIHRVGRKWVWNNSGKPVNGGGGYRRKYRRSYRRRF
jgi:hypothetical protein